MDFNLKSKFIWRLEMDERTEVTYEAINSFVIAIKCCNMDEIKNYLDKYDPIIVNRLETQTRQPSLYFSACLIDHQQSYDIMKLLIDHGANPHFKDNFQQTVLFYVCRDGKEKCLDLLLEQGLSLDDTDLYGQTPLYYVAKENRLNIIHRLMEKKVDLNIRDQIASQTPLFYAAKEGHLEMCKILVENGCDLSIADSQGKLASHTAKKMGKVDVYEYLNNEFLLMREQKKIQDAPESNHHEEKKAKKRKDPATVSLPKSHATVFRLYRSDNFGNINEVTVQQFEELLAHNPKLSEMIKDPDSIDMSELEEIKGKDVWQRAAFRVLQLCWKSKGGFYFHEPVDPAKYGIEDYFQIINEPMDFGTIKKKLNHNVYENMEQFCHDMNLVFDNCVKYNGTENMVSKYAIEIKKMFEENMKQMGV